MHIVRDSKLIDKKNGEEKVNILCCRQYFCVALMLIFKITF